MPYEGAAGEEHAVRLGDGPLVLDLGTPFTVHTCPGRPLSLVVAGRTLAGSAFAPDDPDVEGYLILDWRAFAVWREEEDLVLGHPHDPFDRIDCRQSSRHVVVSADGVTLADSTRPVLLMETPLPLRFYFPRADVNVSALVESTTRSVCAYKGYASYWSAVVGGHVLEDVAWTYEEPLHDAVPVRDLVGFFTERLDLTVDGRPVERPVTPWS